MVNQKFFIAVLLYWAFLCTFPLMAQDDCADAPEYIIYNARIFTMDDSKPTATAMAIKHGKIVAVGNENALLSNLNDDCDIHLLDVLGKTILPGFNDSHCHWFSWREHICDIPNHEHEVTYPDLEETMKLLSANGWTSFSELNFGHPEWIPEHLQNAQDLESRGLLNVRINGYWGTYDGPEFLERLEASGVKPGMVFSDRIRVPGLKIYVDGPFGTADILSPEQTESLVIEAHKRGWAVAAHTVNESAMEMIVSAFEKALGGDNNDQYRHRIEHAVKMNNDQMQRIKDKGLIASFQLMGPPDWPNQETFQTYISNTNPEYCLRWKDFFDEGLELTGSTDAPFNNTVCDYSPFRVIHQAVTRRGYLNRDHAEWEMAQRIAVHEAIESLTIRGAYATGEEDLKGSISQGKFADYMMASENPFDLVHADQLLSIITLQTYLDGSRVYSDESIENELEIVPYSRVHDIIVSASQFLDKERPFQSLDNNVMTQWGSGSHAPQWIQFDFGKDTLLKSIELVVSQFPEGMTIHTILGRSESEEELGYQVLHEFNGLTKDNDQLSHVFENEKACRYIRVLTTESPSWVSWKEITFNQTTITPVEKIEQDDIVVYPQPVKNQLNVVVPGQGVNEITISHINGQTMLFKNFENKSNRLSLNVDHLAPGVYWLKLNRSGNIIGQKILIQ